MSYHGFAIIYLSAIRAYQTAELAEANKAKPQFALMLATVRLNFNSVFVFTVLRTVLSKYIFTLLQFTLLEVSIALVA
jgi:hypothetical protein